jgi:hypothetical protein
MTTEEFLTSIVNESGITRMIIDIESNIKLAEDYVNNFVRLADEIVCLEREYNKIIFGDGDEEEERCDELYNKIIALTEEYGNEFIELTELYELHKINITTKQGMEIASTGSFLFENQTSGEYFSEKFPEVYPTDFMEEEIANDDTLEY